MVLLSVLFSFQVTGSGYEHSAYFVVAQNGDVHIQKVDAYGHTEVATYVHTCKTGRTFLQMKNEEMLEVFEVQDDAMT